MKTEDEQRMLWRPVGDGSSGVTGLTDAEWDRVTGTPDGKVFVYGYTAPVPAVPFDGAAVHEALLAEKWTVEWRDPEPRLAGYVEQARLDVEAIVRASATPLTLDQWGFRYDVWAGEEPAARPDWDTYFEVIAQAAAGRADCTRRKVAALLITPKHHVVATGYNGAPAGVPGCLSAGACPRGRVSRATVPTRSDYATGEGACIADHAERNAVIQFMRLMDDLEVPRERAMALLATCRIQVTCEPCPQCYALLAAVGITDVRWPASSD